MRLRSGPATDSDQAPEPVTAGHRGGRTIGVLIGGGRVAIGVAFALNPVTSVRVLGVDTATANRLAWLAQMTAARDIVLGAGTLFGSISGRGSGPWLLAGAASDLADAAALTSALSRRHVAAVPAIAIAVGAVGLAGLAIADTVRHARA
jgi:hypothetical protein